MSYDEERRRLFDEGVQRQINETHQTEKAERARREEEDMRRLPKSPYRGTSDDDSPWAKATGMIGVFILLIGFLIPRIITIPESWQGPYNIIVIFGGLGLTFISAFPGVFVIFLVGIALWILFKSGYTEAGFKFSIIPLKNWIIIFVFFGLAIFFNKKFRAF